MISLREIVEKGQWIEGTPLQCRVQFRLAKNIVIVGKHCVTFFTLQFNALKCKKAKYSQKRFFIIIFFYCYYQRSVTVLTKQCLTFMFITIVLLCTNRNCCRLVHRCIFSTGDWMSCKIGLLRFQWEMKVERKLKGERQLPIIWLKTNGLNRRERRALHIPYWAMRYAYGIKSNLMTLSQWLTLYTFAKIKTSSARTS